MRNLKTKCLRVTPRSDAELEDSMAYEQEEHMREAYGEMLFHCREHPQDRLWYTGWKITLKETGEDIGGIGFKGPPHENGEVELGYGITDIFQNKGYATQAAKAMTDWAFSQDGVYFVMAEAEADNAPSLRVLEKLGFMPAGDGEEGPRFELEKPVASYTSMYIGIGMCLGLCFGTALDSLSIGLCLGLAIGVAIGAAQDSRDKKKRAELKTKRKGGK